MIKGRNPICNIVAVLLIGALLATMLPFGAYSVVDALGGVPCDRIVVEANTLKALDPGDNQWHSTSFSGTYNACWDGVVTVIDSQRVYGYVYDPIDHQWHNVLMSSNGFNFIKSHEGTIVIQIPYTLEVYGYAYDPIDHQWHSVLMAPDGFVYIGYQDGGVMIVDRAYTREIYGYVYCPIHHEWHTDLLAPDGFVVIRLHDNGVTVIDRRYTREVWGHVYDPIDHRWHSVRMTDGVSMVTRYCSGGVVTVERPKGTYKAYYYNANDHQWHGTNTASSFCSDAPSPPPPLAAFTAIPTSGDPPLCVQFVNCSYGGSNIHWDFGDGSGDSGENPIHKYTSPGYYAVSLTISGPGGLNTETKTNYIYVTNHAPTAYIDLISPNPETEGQIVSFSGHGADLDPGDLITAYNWRSSIDGQLSTSSFFSTSSLLIGTHTIYFKVKDSHDTWSDETTSILTINPANQPPVASFTYSPENAVVGEEITFNASASTDSDGEIISWKWDFGDENIDSGEVVIHAYLSQGEYPVTLTVTDNDGAMDIETKIINVANQPPNQPTNVSPADEAKDVILTPTLHSSSFSGPGSGDTHIASQWQIRESSGDYSNPVFDSGRGTSNLESITIPSGTLNYSSTYYWHVRHQDNHAAWSEWSEETRFTTIEAKGSIEGWVYLEGTSDHSGITVYLDGVERASTNAEGYFKLDNVSVTIRHTVKASFPGYLSAKADVNVVVGEVVTLPKVTLLAGDVNGDGIINSADMEAIGNAFNTADGDADINDDGIVDIYDLVLAGKNFGKDSSPWTGEPVIS